MVPLYDHVSILHGIAVVEAKIINQVAVLSRGDNGHVGVVTGDDIALKESLRTVSVFRTT